MMQRMVLKDFVLVEALELEFHGGFSVLTGETGAGKSILVDALQFALGARADAAVVRQAASRAEVSVEFECTGASTDWLEAGGFHPTDTLLLRRTVDTSGKSRAWINGSAATAAQLRDLGDALVDIHGQHAWHNLMKPATSRALLDAFGQTDTRALALAWREWQAATAALASARDAAGNAERERERLQWQISELQRLAPQAGEWSLLNAEHTRLSNAQNLIDAAQTALQALSEADDNANSLVAQAHHSLSAQAQVEPQFAAHLASLASSMACISDVAHDLRAYLRNTEPDPERLATLDSRLGQWVALARKYRRGNDELAQLLASWQAELAQLDASSDLDLLQNIEQTKAAEYGQSSKIVTQSRVLAAKSLSKAITAAMQSLGMQGGRFEVALTPRSMPQGAAAHGLEDIEFLVAGHPGVAPRPVAKVASGGELSRIALAIAVCTSQLGTAKTLVFDEVDSGIGGAVAETVGRLMKQLGVDRQVLCVTHLPQVAACADQHALVSKVRSLSSTSSNLTWVTGEARVLEVARMLGGEKLSSTTLAHAKEMLES